MTPFYDHRPREQAETLRPGPKQSNRMTCHHSPPGRQEDGAVVVLKSDGRKIFAGQFLNRPFKIIMAILIACTVCRRQRRAVARLNEQLLADIGLTPKMARRVAERPCWYP
jgi:uncharacterized protein YjiS (DUF1127 family)